MNRIAQEIHRAAEERADRLSRIRAETGQLLSGARASLQRVASERRQAATEMAEAMHKSRRAASLLQDARRKQAAKEGKTRREVLRIRTHTGRFLKEASRRQHEQGSKTKEGLLHFVTDLHKGVDGLLQQSHRALQGFAVDFQRGGRQYRRILRHGAAACEQSPTAGGTPAVQGRARGERPPARGPSGRSALRARPGRYAHR
jgi:hypothetical protein